MRNYQVILIVIFVLWLLSGQHLFFAICGILFLIFTIIARLVGRHEEKKKVISHKEIGQMLVNSNLPHKNIKRFFDSKDRRVKKSYRAYLKIKGKK